MNLSHNKIIVFEKTKTKKKFMSSSSNFENQLFFVVVDIDNQFIIAKNRFVFFFFVEFFIILKISSNIEFLRARFFALKKNIIMSFSKFDYC